MQVLRLAPLKRDSLRMTIEKMYAQDDIAKMGSCYPRSENPDLGHPLFVLSEGEKSKCRSFDFARDDTSSCGWRDFFCG
jgi:hypothetical protein